MSKTILIVEDEEDITRALGIRLRSYGYETLAAPGGREGLETARKENPDLILLDLRMADLSGFEFMQELFSEPGINHIPIIVVTASAEKGTEKRCLDMGARAYLTKPFDHKILKEKIEKEIGTPGNPG